jgi:hypothetical protein
VARHDALPSQIATALISVIGIIARIVIGIETQTYPEPNSTAAKTAATEAATTETAAAKAATTPAKAAASTTTTPAKATAAVTTASATAGKGRCAGSTQQERRGAEQAESIHAEQNDHCQTAGQNVAVQFFVLISILSHRALRIMPCAGTHKKRK